jgi:quercetin dioxygenase-like cupin family protein
MFFLCFGGFTRILIGKEKIQVEADNLVESPRDIVHCLYNNSNNIARILVVKAPRPTSPSKLL